MSEETRNEAKKSPVKIKMPEEIAKGTYANTTAVFHTREEFILDFLNVFPPVGVATARIITSPGHIKRIIRALKENLELYENRFGPLEEAAAPPYAGPTGYA